MLGIGTVKSDTILQSIDLGALARDLQRTLRKIDRCNLGSSTREIDRIGPDTAADFQDPLPRPAWKLRKTRDVRFDKILACLDLIEILPRANWFGRVPNVAGTCVPIVMHSRQ